MSHNRTRITRVLSALIVAAFVPVPVARMSSDMPRPAADPQAPGRTRATSLQLPMRFDPSPDAAAGGADFIARGPNYAVYLSGTHTTLVLAPSSGSATTPTTISMRLVGGNRDVAGPAGLEPLPGITNYLTGNDPRLWKTGIHGYRKVKYRGVYPGVDLIYYGNQRQLEYDFVVAPGARAGDIAIAFDGARNVAVDDDGSLAIATDLGTLRQPAPVLYQDVNGARQSIDGGFVIDKAGRVGFRVGRYDRRLPLVIDPVLSYSTYLGGGGSDAALGVAVDAEGSIYLAGETTSLDFPHPNGAQPAYGGSLDAFVAKVNAAGDQLVYATYLGGSNTDYAKDIAVDAGGNAYVTGTTKSPNFPTLHARQATLNGVSDGFVTKLDATGVVVYSTYLGGRAEDSVYGIAVDITGRAHVTGQTISSDFPTAGALQAGLGGGSAWKSTNEGQSWSALSSLAATSANAFAIDPANPGVVYAGTEKGVARSADGGQTWIDNTNFPVQVRALAIDPSATSTVYAGTDLFVMRTRDSGSTWAPIGLFQSSVTSLVIDPVAPTTIYAGTLQSPSSRGVSKSIDGGDHWNDIGIGANVWSLAISKSLPSTIYAGSDFGVFKTTTGGAGGWTPASTGLQSRVWALAVDPTNPAIVYAGTTNGLFLTTSGGNQWLQVTGSVVSSVVIAANAPNSVYAGVAGGGLVVSNDRGATWTLRGPAAPVYALAVDSLVPTTVYTGGAAQQDAFVVRFTPDGSALEYSTFLGGTGFDYGNAIAVDSTGGAYVVGATGSVDLPVLNPLQATFGGIRDLFVAKISPAGALTYATYLGGSAWEDGGSIAVDASGRAHVAGYTLSSNFPTAQAYQPVFGGGFYDGFVATLTSTGNSLVSSTFLGGSGSEMGPGGYIVGRDPVVSIAVTPSGEAYVTGATSSANFPTRLALQPIHGGGEYDAFVAKYSAVGQLQWSTFLGGTGADFGKRIALDPTGGVVVAGLTSSTNFPTRNPLQAGNAGSDDAFLARIVEDGDPVDSTAPTSTIALSGSGGLAGWYRSSVVVTLAAADPVDGSGVAFVDYKIGDAPFQRYVSPFTLSAQGATTVTARATDQAGNVEAVPPSVLMQIDTAAPVLTLDAPAGRDYLHSETVTLSFSASDDVSGLASGSASGILDGAAGANGQQIPLLTLPLGVHTFVASASDAAGNGSQRSVTFRIVATIPSIAAAVNAYVAQGSISRATQKDLLAKLQEAQTALDRYRLADVRRKLADFITLCKKRVPAAPAEVLIADAQYVLGTI